jgi:site-specific DNA-methyltransferase (adenine-specific)
MNLYHGDCLEVLPTLPAQSVDAVICDIPSGRTACAWDVVIPFDAMWRELKRLVKPRGAIVLLGCTQPFTSMLVMSNLEMFKYQWHWKKSRPSSFVDAKNRPLRSIEDICVFSSAPVGHVSLLGEKRMMYNPQGLIRVDRIIRQDAKTRTSKTNGARPSHKNETLQEFTNYPTDLLNIPSVGNAVHPTQKPVPLMEYLIRTYTNEGDTVLDFAMGSGTTLIGCLNTGRRGIGIEQDENYFNVAHRRISDAQAAPVQLELAS